MNITAHLISEELLQDPKNVCFDGSNLHVLNTLRQFFSEYSLTVIDNAEPNIHCLYQFICGPASSLQKFTAEQLRECRKRVIIVQNSSIQQAGEIGKIFNAQVARIGDNALSTDEARVVFGLLFSEEGKVITISETTKNNVTTNVLPLKTPKPIHTIDALPPIDHVRWDAKEKDIETLIHNIYAQKIPGKKRSFTSLLLPLRYAMLAILAFFSLHLLSLFATLFILASFINGTTGAMSALLPSTIEVTVITGRVITQPFPQVTINTLYKRVIDNLDRTGIILKELKTLEHQNNPISAIASNSNESVLPAIEELKKSWGIISPILAVMEGDIKLSKQELSYVPQLATLLDNAQNKLAEMRENGEALFQFSGLLPELTSQEKKYLLLFQNSNELRPTGGFVGSVGFMTFKNNAFESLTIEDVYTIDGQLRGHVDPPLPIRTVLSQEHWYLRDSNWSPNFETSAEKALWFLDKSTGDKADGVIGITLSTIEELLAIIGPINLPDFQTTVDKHSLFTFVYNTTQENFFPGSQKKRDVLTALSKAIELKLKNASTKELFSISTLLAKNIKNREIQFYSTDGFLQQHLSQLKLTGAFPPKNPCPIPSEQFCAEDLFAVVEANLAVNKTNAYVSREFARDITIEEKELFRVDTLKWNNSADQTSAGGGNYIVYSRLYYPAGTAFQSLAVNDKPLDIQTATSSSRPLPYAEFVDEFPGVVTLGIAQDILVGTSSLVRINSSQPLPATPHGYSLTVFRQAGSLNLPFSLNISSPNRIIQTTTGNPDLVANNGAFTYNRRLQRDEQVFVALTSEDP